VIGPLRSDPAPKIIGFINFTTWDKTMEYLTPISTLVARKPIRWINAHPVLAEGPSPRAPESRRKITDISYWEHEQPANLAIAPVVSKAEKKKADKAIALAEKVEAAKSRAEKAEVEKSKAAWAKKTKEKGAQAKQASDAVKAKKKGKGKEMDMEVESEDDEE
jgi:hypothetical protein